MRKKLVRYSATLLMLILILSSTFLPSSAQSTLVEEANKTSVQNQNSGLKNSVSISSKIVPNDPGVAWSVVSQPGFHQATLMLKLPTIYETSESAGDRSYLFYSVHGYDNALVSTAVVGDYGLIYIPQNTQSNKETAGWHLVTNTGVWNKTTKQYDKVWYVDPNRIEKACGAELPMQVSIVNAEDKDSVTLTIMDNRGVLATRTVDFPSSAFNDDCSNVRITRHISVTRAGQLDSASGTRIENAVYSNALLYDYDKNGAIQSHPWTNDSQYTWQVRRQAPSQPQLDAVKINAFSGNSEDISILLTQYDQSSLYFDFTNDNAAQQRYENNSGYCGINFDLPQSWITNRSLSMRDGNAVMTVLRDDGFVGHYMNLRGADGTSSHVLDYSPSENDILQIRFKLRNCKAAEENPSLYILFKVNDETEFSWGKDRSIRYVLETASMKDEEYHIATIAMPDGWKNADRITGIQLNFAHILPIAETQIHIDYLYFGCPNGAPSCLDGHTFRAQGGSDKGNGFHEAWCENCLKLCLEAHHYLKGVCGCGAFRPAIFDERVLLFDFEKNQNSLNRYQNDSYGYIDFDFVGNWY